MGKRKEITQEEFDDILNDILSEEKANQLLTIAGIYEIVSEEYNNKVLKRWENDQEVDE